MTRPPITFVPPYRAGAASDEGAVRKRHVLYVPGYDPEAKVRARALFIRELGRFGRRFGVARRVSAPRMLPDVPAQGWTVRSSRDGWEVETTYEVLLWDDIVAEDFRRPALATATAIAFGTWATVSSGMARRLLGINWMFGTVFVYPYVVLALTALAMLAAGLGAGLALRAQGLPAWLGAAGGIGAAGLVAAILVPRLSGWYVWHLLRDWLFNWEHGSGIRHDYTDRVGRFADHLRRVAAGTDADEVVVIGHSSGATTAMEVTARALERDPDLGRRGPRICLLTLGTSLPAAAFHPEATAILADLRRLVTTRDVLWVEYQAPQDWLNAAWFNPLRMLPLGVPESASTNPVIRSARFSDIVTEETYRAMRYNPFRMHFQFMMANDRAAEYDYFMIVLGPMALSQRIARPEAAAALVAPVTEALEPATDMAQSLNTETARP